nr:DUF47 family protein [Candidatus Sigynarchaeota archaeon]
ETAEVDKLGLLAKDSDFSTLVLKADSIIDYAEGVGQRLMFCKWQKLPNKVSQKAIQLSEAIMDAAVLVRELVFAYFEKADKVPRICNQIDGAERKSDVLFREIQGILFSDDLNDVDLRKILPFLDAMEHLEDMGDLAEQLADSFKISYVAKFGVK